MKIILGTLEFEWDRDNLDKNYEKHGISAKEAEEIFVNEELFVLPDVKHSQKEPRYIALGSTRERKNLFVVFTVRNEKIRIVSVRSMHRKEIEKYEKAQKNSEI